jgi:Flp pilus assembly protein TadG
MAMSKPRHRPVTDLRGARKREKGQASVEFALTIIFLVLLIVGFLELVMMMYTYTVLANSAKEGVRYAAVHGSFNATPSGPACPCTDIDGPAAPIGTAPGNGSGYGVVRSYAQASLHYIAGTAMTVTATYPDTTNPPANQPPNRIRVVVSYPYQPFFGLGWPTLTVNAAAEGRITF